MDMKKFPPREMGGLLIVCMTNLPEVCLHQNRKLSQAKDNAIKKRLLLIASKFGLEAYRNRTISPVEIMEKAFIDLAALKTFAKGVD